MSIARTYAVGRVAGGNHLTADCDEPEPRFSFSEEELLAADVQRSLTKAQRFHERNDRQALEDQVQRMRALGAL